MEPDKKKDRRAAAIMLPVMLVGGGVFLSSCQTSGDPAEGGFFNGVQDLLDGTYGKRQAEQQREIERQRGVIQALEKRAEELQAEREAMRAEVATLLGRLTTMQRSLDQRKKELKGISKKREQMEEYLEQRTNELERLKGELHSLQSNEDGIPYDITVTRQRLRALNNTVNKMEGE
ncbi:hypothetical protein [Magnetospira sp. QH-2]|uniref:hypothetical protein n=1 Tax=Magnetospira sp. (strain QH-2) TaxID=1288970 RepID=UPI0003E80FEF|nr:hypothetical protein [Magnetospira sp. QH-2]CCQ73207.1 Putative lipoprotein [Magnetospira sp. QH-2]